MKTNPKTLLPVIMALILANIFQVSPAQTRDAEVRKYLSALPSVQLNRSVQKYRMTAVYTNRDLYGNFTGKTKVSGEYTKNITGDSCRWNNVYISPAANYKAAFPEGQKQSYIEGFTYIPSDKMLQADAFSGFPPTPEAVLSKNLVWDMMAIESFAWQHYDSLKLNRVYSIPGSDEKFAMADIGTYEHSGIDLCWTGISEMNGVLCAIIEFRAIDNKISLEMEALKTKGTEQYWGTIWMSLKDKSNEHAEMYSGTIQEIAVTGMENKFLAKTIRDLSVDKIQ
jgi:hypothetical protein